MKTKGCGHGHQNSLLLLVGTLIVLALTVSACGSAATETAPAPTVAPQTTLTVSGAVGTTRVLKFLANEYSMQHGDLAFEFLSGSGSSGGVRGVLTSQLDLGAMSRPPKDSELAAGIAHVGFAEDKVVVVTSPDLTLTGLTSQQVKDIFQGVITNWSDVGGPDAPLVVIFRGEEDSNTKILRKSILGDAEYAAGSVFMTSEAEANAALSSGTNAIGYLAYSGALLEDLPVHALVLDDQDPADVGSSYPLDARLLGVAYLPANAAKVQPFLDFITSSEAQVLLAEQGIATVH